MKFCFGTVCWGGYLNRYIDIFVDNYSLIFKKLIEFGIAYGDISAPKVVYSNDTPAEEVETARKKLLYNTGKELELVQEEAELTNENIMYSTRNRLRLEYKKSYPDEKKVFFYFPIDDRVRSDAVLELMKISQAEDKTACMFKFLVTEGATQYSAATRPICTCDDIHPEDWGGYCAYNILNEEECPLYPEIAIPNVAFYAALYKAGYKEYSSRVNCVDHLRHPDSHHFKTKDTKMSDTVREYLLNVRDTMKKEGYK